MADDADKTELPTPRKVHQARERGKVGKSNDLTAALMLFVALLFLYIFGQSFVDLHLDAAVSILGGFATIDLTADNLQVHAIAAVFFVLSATLPYLLILLVAAVFCNLIQVGLLFSFQPITPDFAKINPISGLQQKFSLRTLNVGLMKIGKVVLISWIAHMVIAGAWREIFMTTAEDLAHSLGLLNTLFFRLSFLMVLVLFLLGIADYAFQKWQYTTRSTGGRGQGRRPAPAARHPGRAGSPPACCG